MNHHPQLTTIKTKIGFERMESSVNSLEKGSYSSAPVQDCDLKTENKSESGPPQRQLNVGAEPYNLQINRNTYSEYAKVFAKKDLVSKIHLFDDNPENFSSWKASFKNAVRELSLTPVEEMDLLIQWLGNTASATQAKSIRNANAANPDRGVQRIWDRLHDRFANPEVVESAIKRKLVKFPKLGNKDNAKLYELFDIVSEIEALKRNPTYSTLLAYFDSSSDVNPIIAKLPHNIQEKWTTEATNFKRRTRLPYPTFPVFVEFLETITKMRNDPSLQFDVSLDSNKGEQQKVYKGRRPSLRNKAPVTVFKTQLRNSPPQKSNSLTTTGCPIHESMKHTLNECRQFRARPIEERRTFIKENGYCFRCSETHEIKVF